MNIKILVPVFCYGSNLHQVNLDEIQEKQFQSILQNDYVYNLQLCDIKQLTHRISIEKRVILFIQSEELFGYSEELQEIFNLLHFFKVEKGLCFIIDKEKVKNQEKKTSLINQYINNSSNVFKEIFSHKLDFSIFSITKAHSINTYLHYFNTTPLEINSAMFDENLIQILSRDKKQLEIKVLKGILYKNGRFYLQDQTEQNKPIYIEKIEEGLIFVNQFSQSKSFKIEISDDSEYTNQTFMSNKPFNVKSEKDNFIIHASFSSEESLNRFNFDYRKAKELYSLVVGKSEYNIATLEFFWSNTYANKVVLTLKLKQDENFPVYSYDDNHSKANKVNESFVVFYKNSNEIAFFGQNLLDNCTITLPPKVAQENNTIEIHNFYVPIQENEIIQKIERGEEVQNGKQILKCRICFEQLAATILIPCGHIRYCFDCSTDLQECLFCETKIEKRKQISIKLMDPEIDSNLQEIPFKFNDFLIQSIKNNTNIDLALQMEYVSREMKLNDYYCQNCQQKKGCNFTFCEKDHVINYCKNCYQQDRTCQLKDCKAKILYKKQIIYKFDE